MLTYAEKLKILQCYVDNHALAVSGGRVYRIKKRVSGKWVTITPKLADLKLTSNGYRRVFLSLEGKRFTMAAHRVVIAVCTGELVPEDMDVHHKNSDKGDNRISNLEIVSPEKNQTYVNMSFHAFPGDTLVESEAFAYFTKRALESHGNSEKAHKFLPGVPLELLEALELGLIWPQL